MTVTLLGPQRRPTLDTVIRSYALDGPVATVTAGWQEREPDDGELDRLLDGRSINLGLYGRWLDVQERDREFAAALRDQRRLLEEMADLYLVRLERALDAVFAVGRRPARPPLLAEALADAETALRWLDSRHLERVGAVHAEFSARWTPHHRTEIAEHRAAVAGLLGRSGALVVAGGHVGVLSDALHLFAVAPAVRSAEGFPVVAWSAGAMAIADRIVLFYDGAIRGAAHAEIYDRGIGLATGVVPLPHARRRLPLGDATRMGVFARRFAPATCVVLDDGVRVDLAGGRCPSGAPVIGPDGKLAAVASA